jgi:hypothetical protein
MADMEKIVSLCKRRAFFSRVTFAVAGAQPGITAGFGA